MKQVPNDRLLKPGTIPPVVDTFSATEAIDLLKGYMEVENADEVMDYLSYEIEHNQWFSRIFREIYTAALTGDLTKSEADRFVSLFHHQLSFHTPGLTPQEALAIFLVSIVLIFMIVMAIEPESTSIQAVGMGVPLGIINTMIGIQIGKHFRTRKGTQVHKDSESVKEALRSLNDERYRANQDDMFEREENLSAPTNIQLVELIDEVNGMTTEEARKRLGNAALNTLQDEA
jgi:hypothetical protein